MFVNNSISNILNLNKPSTSVGSNPVSTSSTQNIYKSDSMSFSTIEKPQPPIDIPPPEDTTPFFKKPEVRLGGMIIGSGLAFGGIGYAVGASMGAKTAGMAIGGTVGVLAPIALLGYALYKWKNS